MTGQYSAAWGFSQRAGRFSESYTSMTGQLLLHDGAVWLERESLVLPCSQRSQSNVPAIAGHSCPSVYRYRRRVVREVLFDVRVLYRDAVAGGRGGPPSGIAGLRSLRQLPVGHLVRPEAITHTAVPRDLVRRPRGSSASPTRSFRSR